MKRACLLLLWTVVGSAWPRFDNLSAQTLELLATGLSRPLYVTASGDGSGRLFIVEQPGFIRIIEAGQLLPQPFLDLSSQVREANIEGGLLGLAFHPDYHENGRFFVYYYTEPPRRTVLSEFKRMSEDPLQAVSQEKVLLEIPQDFSNHNGGMLEFGPDGFLYLAVGDGSRTNESALNAQDTGNLLGAILRLDVDGEMLAAQGNPLIGQQGRDEIWAWGLRNPWRFSFDRGDGRLFLGDVGESSREELNLIQPGKNYGWPILEGTFCYGGVPEFCSSPQFEPPIFDYERTEGSSITAGYVYRGRSYPFLWGYHVFGDFISGRIWMLLDQETPRRTRLLLETEELISSFGVDEEGELLVVGLGGTVSRLVLRDFDGDGVSDLQEDAGPFSGNANQDGLPDREQSFIATISRVEGTSYSILVEPNLELAEARRNPRLANELSLRPDELPFDGVEFQVFGLEPGTSAAVTLLFSDLRGVNDFLFLDPGAVPLASEQPILEREHLVQLGTHSLQLMLTDGAPYDLDGPATGSIRISGGALASASGPVLRFIPQIVLGRSPAGSFEVVLVAVNTGDAGGLQLTLLTASGEAYTDLSDGEEMNAWARWLPSGASLSEVLSGSEAAEAVLDVLQGRLLADPSVDLQAVLRANRIPSLPGPLFETALTPQAAGRELYFPVQPDTLDITGLVLLNPPEGLQPVRSNFTVSRIELRLLDQAGLLLGEVEMSLQDGAQTAVYLSQLFPGINSETAGSLKIRSTRPIVALAMRQRSLTSATFTSQIPTLNTFFPIRPDQP